MMPVKGRTKREVVAEFRHEEILEAARRVFGEKGFRETAVEQIAQAAGVAKGTVYLYYPSKEALYQAALEDGLRRLVAEVRLRMESAVGLRAQIHAFVATKLEHFEQHRDLVRIFYAEMGQAMAHPACLQGRFRDLYLEQLEMLKSALAAAAERGEVRGLDVELAACVLFDVTRGLITNRLLGRSPANGPDHSEVGAVVELVWNGLSGR
jgi:AcrR family transcriptional regulator